MDFVLRIILPILLFATGFLAGKSYARGKPIQITIKTRPFPDVDGSYQAWIEGQPNSWVGGSSRNEAVGILMRYMNKNCKDTPFLGVDFKIEHE